MVYIVHKEVVAAVEASGGMSFFISIFVFPNLRLGGN